MPTTPMKEMIMPPTSQMDAITEVQPLSGVERKTR